MAKHYIKTRSFKTPYDRAEKAGKELLAKATEEHNKRKEYNSKETFQACKEMATYFVHKRNERVMICGGSVYDCFACLNRLKSPCKHCRDGEYFHRKGAN